MREPRPLRREREARRARGPRLAERLNALLERALDVGGLVRVDDATGRHPVELSLDIVELGFGGLTLCQTFEVFHHGADAELVLAVAEAALSVLTDALGSGLVLGHEAGPIRIGQGFGQSSTHPEKHPGCSPLS